MAISELRRHSSARTELYAASAAFFALGLYAIPGIKQQDAWTQCLRVVMMAAAAAIGSAGASVWLQHAEMPADLELLQSAQSPIVWGFMELREGTTDVLFFCFEDGRVVVAPFHWRSSSLSASEVFYALAPREASFGWSEARARLFELEPAQLLHAVEPSAAPSIHREFPATQLARHLLVDEMLPKAGMAVLLALPMVILVALCFQEGPSSVRALQRAKSMMVVSATVAMAAIAIRWWYRLARGAQRHPFFQLASQPMELLFFHMSVEGPAPLSSRRRTMASFTLRTRSKIIHVWLHRDAADALSQWLKANGVLSLEALSRRHDTKFSNS